VAHSLCGFSVVLGRTIQPKDVCGDIESVSQGLCGKDVAILAANDAANSDGNGIVFQQQQH
jgi:hypothetical protein